MFLNVYSSIPNQDTPDLPAIYRKLMLAHKEGKVRKSDCKDDYSAICPLYSTYDDFSSADFSPSYQV